MTSSLPTVKQEQLLDACFLPDIESVAAFKGWEAGNGLEHVDPASYQLLPLLYRTLASAGVSHPCMAKLKGVYRRSWYANQRLLRRTADVLGRLHFLEIPAMLIGGAAMALRYYGDIGVRPLREVALMVPANHAEQALGQMQDLGFSTITWTPSVLEKDFLRFRHAIRFRDKEGSEIQLQWRAIGLAREGAYSSRLWEDSLPLEACGTTVRSLQPSDELLVTCARGLPWETPPLWWVADAIVLIRRSGEIDWERLLRFGRETRLILPLGEALCYVARRFDSPVPGGFLQEMKAVAVSRSDRRLHLWISNPEENNGLLTLASACLAMNRRTIGSDSRTRSLTTLPRFLQYHWRLNRKSDLPRRAWAWMVERSRQHQAGS